MATTPSLQPLPVTFGRADLDHSGFLGWRSWTQLRKAGFAGVPTGPAAYVVYSPAVVTVAQVYLDLSVGRRFKGRDPTISVETLKTKWVPGAAAIYIGKADVANRRLKQFGRFGAGDRSLAGAAGTSGISTTPINSSSTGARSTGARTPESTRSGSSPTSPICTTIDRRSRTSPADAMVRANPMPRRSPGRPGSSVPASK
jgi:hypothetical protein